MPRAFLAASWTMHVLRCLLIAIPFLGQAATTETGTHALPRVSWTNTRLLGTPEPPSPYVIRRVFTNVVWKNPMYVAPLPATDRIWVILQGGEAGRPSRIVSIPNRDEVGEPEVETAFTLEQRLIYGLTFHPGFATNRQVYLFSNGPTGSERRTNHIDRARVSLQPPYRIEPGSTSPIIEWASAGHDGGDLAFGRDGMLYITSGDGSSDSDSLDSGQDLSNLLATLIRIDVDHPAPGRTYAVPADNPFRQIPGARPEIWAYGFRNPWRMDIDAVTGDVWVGQNGQDLWETAYLVRRGDNFGWSVFEGSHPFHPNRRRGPTPVVPPTIEHSHADFRSLTGGVVYRGKDLPALDGTYVYGDYGTGKIWGARHRDGTLTWNRELVDTALQIVAFRVDQRGRLLVVDHAGGIYRIVPRPASSPPPLFPARLSDTGLFADVPALRPAPGLVPYDVNAPGWADGANARRLIALPGTNTMRWTGSRSWGFPDETVLVQTLGLPLRDSDAGSVRRIETRVLVRLDGEWTGYSYRWNEDQTDATLAAKEGEELSLSRHDAAGKAFSQTWKIPSRSECMACHSRAAGFVLGITDAQMNRPDAPPAGSGAAPENQLSRLKRLGVLVDLPAEDPSRRAALADPYDARLELESRARSYLHANCSVCHIAAGGGNSRMELEFTQPRDAMNLVEARPQHDTCGLADAMLVAPGHPERSVLIHRLSRRGRGQMPPLVSSRVDERAVALMRDWIGTMKPSREKFRAWTMADLQPVLARPSEPRDVAAGKATFRRLGCNQCHVIQGEGGNVGPALDDAGRRLGLSGVLASILDPSKEIADAYANHEIELRDGDVLSGRIERETDHELFLRTGSGVDNLTAVPKARIARRSKSTLSNMPAGMLDVLTENEILDLLAYLVSAAEPRKAASAPRRVIAHWADYANADYVPFIRDARPDVAQVGFYGAHFYSLVHTPHHAGYPAHFPVRGLAEGADWFAGLNRRLHEAGTRVVGHFNVEFLVGDPDSPEGPRGFFHFYRHLWDEKVLGPKPVEDPVQLLERRKEGTPISNQAYGIGGMREYWACLRNPAWQKVLEAWVRRGIELGVDGFIANYFYRHDCACEHCDRAFRDHLRRQFHASELRSRFGIEDLDHHVFDAIVSWHDPASSTPLKREMLRFSQISNKEVFDRVFVRYGRSLRPDLLVAQWNHLGDFSAISGDERCLLSSPLWARDEDYLWYSLGDVANHTDLARGLLGEGTLQARYLQGASGGKPFTLGKYESTRIRTAIAELAANGGAPMGFYANFTDPEAREALVRYYRFLARYDAIYRDSRPSVEARLIFPRRAIHEGDLRPLEDFRRLGRRLLDDHVLFDVIPDDLGDGVNVGDYPVLVRPGSSYNPAELNLGSRFTAPKTVRVSLSRPATPDHEWDLHLVNYDRVEPPRTAEGRPSPGGGIRDEKPIPTPTIDVALRSPVAGTPSSVEFLTPEAPESVPLKFTMNGRHVQFTVPSFVVYGVVRVKFG